MKISVSLGPVESRGIRPALRSLVAIFTFSFSLSAGAPRGHSGGVITVDLEFETSRTARRKLNLRPAR